MQKNKSWISPAAAVVVVVPLFSGNVDHKVVPWTDLLDPAHCTLSEEWSVGFPGAVCDHTVNFHRLSFNKPKPSTLEAKDAIFSNTHGNKTDAGTPSLRALSGGKEDN